jgi:two-component system, chemotaxis family, chemotaxis protein CheY
MAVDKNMRILVVDDHWHMAQLIRAMLEDFGFPHAEIVTDVQVALQKLRTVRHGLIISDLNMRPINGLEFLRFVRANPKIGETPFIIISGVGTLENVAMTKEIGVDAFVAKPFTAATLKGKLVAVLGDF